jgi:hypothetical protein
MVDGSMSIDAVNRAFALNLRPADRKFVLIALANFVDEANACFPCLELLHKRTGQSEGGARASQGAGGAGLISQCQGRQAGQVRARARHRGPGRTMIWIGQYAAQAVARFSW